MARNNKSPVDIRPDLSAQRREHWRRLFSSQLEQGKKVESIATAYKADLSSRLFRTIREFNRRVDPYQRILSHAPPSMILIAEKNSFPAGLLEIGLDTGERQLTCTYFYMDDPDQMPYRMEQKYQLRIDARGIVLLHEDRPVPESRVVEELLGPFLARVLGPRPK